MAKLFGALSVKSANVIANEALRPIVEQIQRKNPYVQAAYRQDPIVPRQPLQTQKVVLGFSGGKDSLAVALRLMRQGFQPIPLYVRGINPAYPHEFKAAQDLAAALGLPLKVLHVRLRDKSEHIENPVKNQLILSLQLDLASRLGGSIVAQGNLAEDRANDMAYSSGFSDSWEMYEAFERAAQAFVPGAKVMHSTIKNETDSFKEIFSHPAGAQLLDLASSCMMPLRYKGLLRARNLQKFGKMLPPGRCGSCYKCADELLHRAAFMASDISTAQKQHCLAVARTAWPKIYGEKCSLSDGELLAHFVDASLV